MDISGCMNMEEAGGEGRRGGGFHAALFCMATPVPLPGGHFCGHSLHSGLADLHPWVL